MNPVLARLSRKSRFLLSISTCTTTGKLARATSLLPPDESCYREAVKPAEQLDPPTASLLLSRRVEEASLNAWPAMHQMLVDGWLLRFAKGFTKRANSVVPLYPAAGTLAADMAEKVKFCENLYARERLQTIFRLTSIGTTQGSHQSLDDYLAARGYEHRDPTLVMTAPLIERTASIRLGLLPLGEWLDVYGHLSGLPEKTRTKTRALHGAILRGMPQPCAYAVIGNPARPLACGLGVLEQELLGLFDVVTSQSARRRGHGRSLVAGLLAWGRQQGATQAYLQMTENNHPARALYDSLGFQELYRYWYRVSP